MRKKHSETGCVNSALMTSQYDSNYSELFAPEHYLGLEMIRRHCSLPVEDPRLFCGLWLQNTTFDSNNETNLKILNLKLLFVKEFSLNFGNPARFNQCECLGERPHLKPTLIK
jgi:hypothetical protein